MKDSLIQITRQIIDSIEIDVVEFQVYEENDTLPEILKSIVFQSEYLVCVWITSNDSVIAKEQYESFLHKPVILIKNHQSNILCWFEGFSLKNSTEINKDKNENITNNETVRIQSLKNTSILPTWLQQRIFEKYNAQYAPNHERYEQNLNLSDDELKVYLGTYFPRSYGESFCVFDNIFESKPYLALASKEVINILDIGCGTGGNLIGLLVALNKYNKTTKKVNVIAIDGHINALSILSDLVDEFSNKATFAVNLNTKTQSIDSVKELGWVMDSEFDFIMSFKMGCELIAEGNTNFYYDLTKFSLPLLSKTGLFFLLDVTTKVGITYNPILMNIQVNRAIKELTGYKTLIPITCGEFEKECVEQCFTQRTFNISHSLKINDKSKVAYRIIANSNLVNQISLFESSCSYINIFEKDDNFGKYCPNSQGEQIKDNYKI